MRRKKHGYEVVAIGKVRKSSKPIPVYESKRQAQQVASRFRSDQVRVRRARKARKAAGKRSGARSLALFMLFLILAVLFVAGVLYASK